MLDHADTLLKKTEIVLSLCNVIHLKPCSPHKTKPGVSQVLFTA